MMTMTTFHHPWHVWAGEPDRAEVCRAYLDAIRDGELAHRLYYTQDGQAYSLGGRVVIIAATSRGAVFAASRAFRPVIHNEEYTQWLADLGLPDLATRMDDAKFRSWFRRQLHKRPIAHWLSHPVAVIEVEPLVREMLRAGDWYAIADMYEERGLPLHAHDARCGEEGDRLARLSWRPCST